MIVDGDAAAVVGDADAAVDVDRDVDVLAVAGQGLIDAVVDQLVDEVVQPLGAGVADVHAGRLADVGRSLPASSVHALGTVFFRASRVAAAACSSIGRSLSTRRGRSPSFIALSSPRLAQFPIYQ